MSDPAPNLSDDLPLPASTSAPSPAIYPLVGSPSPVRPAKPIGHLAARGMAWSGVQGVSTKCVTILQQILIAKYFLSQDDFGLLARTQVIISVTCFGQLLGIGEILVRRHRRFERWIDAGFWFNFTGGITGMLLTLAVIPIWGPAFRGITHALGYQLGEAPRIEGLLFIWALWIPMDAILQVLIARLRVDMRFRALAALASMQLMSLAILGLFFAWLGFGAFSLVLPLPLFTPVTVATAWIMTRQRIRLRPNVRRWPALARDSRFILTSNLLTVLLNNADYMVSGVFFSNALLGAYYFAYRMSTQTQQLVSGNVTAVLTPSFSKIDDDETRRRAAYERTVAALMLVGLPLCFLQAVLADPGLHLLYKHKWDDAIGPFALLSIGMAFALPLPAAVALLQAQGRYRLNVRLIAVQAGGFLSFVLVGALCGSIFTVAAFVGLYFVIFGPLTVAVPIWRHGAGGVLWRALRFPVASGVVAAGGAWGVAAILPWQGLWMQLAIRTLVWGVLTAAGLLLIRPKAAVDLWTRFGGKLRQGSNAAGA